jgi:hypothetical protein
MVIKKIEGEGAITITSLVITIIILLILAGISISILVGPDGIIERAKTSVSTYKQEEIREKVELKIANLNLEKMATEEIGANLKDVLELKDKDEEIIDGYESGNNVVLIIDKYQCEIDENLEVKSVNSYNPNQLKKVKRKLEFCSFEREEE